MHCWACGRRTRRGTTSCTSCGYKVLDAPKKTAVLAGRLASRDGLSYTELARSGRRVMPRPDAASMPPDKSVTVTTRRFTLRRR